METVFIISGAICGTLCLIGFLFMLFSERFDIGVVLNIAGFFQFFMISLGYMSI